MKTNREGQDDFKIIYFFTILILKHEFYEKMTTSYLILTHILTKSDSV